MTQRYRELLADFSLIVVATIWGVTFLMVQEATREVPVFAFLFWRFLLASSLFFILGMLLKQLIFDLDSFRSGIKLGVLLCSGFMFQTFGLQYAPSSIVGFITGMYVVFVPILMWLFFKERASIFTLIGVFSSAFGLWLISTEGRGVALGSGEILTLVSSLFFAAHIVFTGIFSIKHKIFPLIFGQFCTAAIISLLLSLCFDSRTIPAEASHAFLKALIITAVFATVLADFTQTYVQRFTTPAKVAVIFTIEPLSAGIFGYYVGGEALGIAQILGGALIIIAMLSIELGTLLYKRKKPR